MLEGLLKLENLKLSPKYLLQMKEKIVLIVSKLGGHHIQRD